MSLTQFLAQRETEDRAGGGYGWSNRALNQKTCRVTSGPCLFREAQMTQTWEFGELDKYNSSCTDEQGFFFRIKSFLTCCWISCKVKHHPNMADSGLFDYIWGGKGDTAWGTCFLASSWTNIRSIHASLSPPLRNSGYHTVGDAHLGWFPSCEVC